MRQGDCLFQAILEEQLVWKVGECIMVGKVIQTTLPLFVTRQVNNKTTYLITAKRSTKQNGNARTVTSRELLLKRSTGSKRKQLLESVVIQSLMFRRSQ